MTQIATGTTLRRETATLYRGRPLIVEAHSGYLTVWPKGTQQRTSVPYDAIYEVGLKMEALDRRKEKFDARRTASRRAV